MTRITNTQRCVNLLIAIILPVCEGGGAWNAPAMRHVCGCCEQGEGGG